MTDNKPLYQQVRERLLKRIQKGEWQPGEIIPNEFEIAAEYDVSQGTARKAIGDLADSGILTRQQGRGTFVTEHLPGQGLSRFPGFVNTAHEPLNLGSLACTCNKALASPDESAALGIERGAPVLRLYRLRTLNGTAIASEAISLPARLFRSFKPADATDALYDLYQREFGVHVVRIADKLSAVEADKRRAKELKVSIGAPLLKIDRTAFALDNQKVEWRVSLCHPQDLHYLNTGI